ncbi:phage protease [Neomegalonema sp.]|uniref:phage protease n=1 Tax=Neomegalonema sp. TaxID=2039713 RepID=UPI00260EDB87|nr:phage protease [Neomegalonema sp.]MDD2870118.1 phage protease [Neomegalonema sp.]
MIQLATHAMSLPEGEPPEWAHLLPSGAFRGRDGRGPYLLKDAQAVVLASAGGPGDPESPVDYDHQTDLAAVRGVGGTAPAAGWIKAFEARADGIWARMEWTPRGAAALAAREYRYLSPVFEHDASGEIRRVLRAALTNNPNLRLTALAAAEPQSDGDDMDPLAEISATLGLPQGSDAAATLAAVKALKASAAGSATALASALKTAGLPANAAPADLEAKLRTALAAATPDPSRYAPMEMVTSLQAQIKGLTEARAVDLVEQAVKAGKIPPANKDWALAYHAKDPEGFAQYLRNQPALLPSGETAAADQPPGGDVLDAQQLAICSAMGQTPEEFRAARKKEGL